MEYNVPFVSGTLSSQVEFKVVVFVFLFLKWLIAFNHKNQLPSICILRLGTP